jgi:hypothetical protein
VETQLAGAGLVSVTSYLPGAKVPLGMTKVAERQLCTSPSACLPGTGVQAPVSVAVKVSSPTCTVGSALPTLSRPVPARTTVWSSWASQRMSGWVAVSVGRGTAARPPAKVALCLPSGFVTTTS